MSYSINFYLDNPISKRKLNQINQPMAPLDNNIQKRISEKELQIFLYLRYSGKTLKIYAERKCTQKQWDFSKQRINPNYYKSGAVDINEYLNRIINESGKLFESNNNKGIQTTKEQLQDIIYRLSNKKSAEIEVISFENAYENFISHSQLSKQPNTIKKYITTRKHLNNFAKSRKVKLSFEKVNLDFQDSLRQYFINDLQLSNNSIAKYFKCLKTFLNFCTDRGYNQTMIYKKFSAVEKLPEVYALTVEELMKLYHYGFDDTRLEKVKDVFCFSCFTGIRFSDVVNLNRENIIGDKIRITVQKTQDSMEMQLNEFALAIIRKYTHNERPLPVISSQKTNNYLKEIGKMLNFSEPVKTVKYSGPNKIERNVPKYEVLTFHISRKTFVTTSLILGMHERAVKEFSGHKSEANFRRYVKFAESYKNKVMISIWNKENVDKALIDLKQTE